MKLTSVLTDVIITLPDGSEVTRQINYSSSNPDTPFDLSNQLINEFPLICQMDDNSYYTLVGSDGQIILSFYEMLTDHKLTLKKFQKGPMTSSHDGFIIKEIEEEPFRKSLLETDENTIKRIRSFGRLYGKDQDPS